MRILRVIPVLCVLLSVSVAGAAVSLQINGTGYDILAIKSGQSVTVQVVSDNSTAYSVYAGIDDAETLDVKARHQNSQDLDVAAVTARCVVMNDPR